MTVYLRGRGEGQINGSVGLPEAKLPKHMGELGIAGGVYGEGDAQVSVTSENGRPTKATVEIMTQHEGSSSWSGANDGYVPEHGKRSILAPVKEFVVDPQTGTSTTRKIEFDLHNPANLAALKQSLHGVAQSSVVGGPAPVTGIAAAARANAMADVGALMKRYAVAGPGDGITATEFTSSVATMTGGAGAHAASGPKFGFDGELSREVKTANEALARDFRTKQWVPLSRCVSPR